MRLRGSDSNLMDRLVDLSQQPKREFELGTGPLMGPFTTKRLLSERKPSLGTAPSCRFSSLADRLVMPDRHFAGLPLI
jgi:hypothetical protein